VKHLRIYVAGSSKEMDRARKAMDAVRAHGWTLTQDWVAIIEEKGAPNLVDDVIRKQCAEADADAVLKSNVFWLLAPHTRTSGAWFEMGVAWMKRKQDGEILIIASGPGEQSIFCALADCEFEHDGSALDWLEDYAKA
jgi:hypothetical protein